MAAVGTADRERRREAGKAAWGTLWLVRVALRGTRAAAVRGETAEIIDERVGVTQEVGGALVKTFQVLVHSWQTWKREFPCSAGRTV